MFEWKRPFPLGLKYHFETYSTSIMTTRLLCQTVKKGLNVQITLRRGAKRFLSDRHQLSTLPTLLLSTLTNLAMPEVQRALPL